jgi:2-oxoglutarate dehydrogenase E2 component (dihydrolipoamide succinyltransferase)
MSVEIKTPILPESVSDATVLNWHKQVGEPVTRDELLVELETDKVVLEVPVPEDGVLESIVADTGAIVTGEQVLGTITPGVAAAPLKTEVVTSTPAEPAAPSPAAPPPPPAPKAPPVPPPPAPTASAFEKTSPAVRKLLQEHGLGAARIQGTGKNGRITKEDVLAFLDSQRTKAEQPSPPVEAAAAVEESPPQGERLQRRVPMTRLRARIAERMLEAKQSTAMLTTFNEVNMKNLMDLRTQYREAFEKMHGSKLGIMSMFVKASTIALRRFPEVNASIDNSDIIYHGYCDIGIAVASERGLVVPVLRNTEHMSLAQIETTIVGYAQKAREDKLTIEDLTGGTFTITNGGVFGSLLSTPILNPPQSAILGMHTIQNRPVAEDGQVVIRPMMYVALSYDHRIIDGQGAVSFLKTIKELVEQPSRVLLDV